MASANGRSKRWARILYTLAMEGPLNPYKTWAKLVKEELATQPTIRGDLEELLKIGLVKNVDTDRRARGGRPSTRYDLSLPGLMEVITALRDNERDHRRLDYLAEKYRGLMPSVFDAWPAILEAKIGDLAFDRLQLVCSTPRFRREQITKDSQDLSEDAIAFFFDPVWGDATRDGDQRWLQGIQGNRILRDGAKRALRYRIAWHNHEIAEFTDMVREEDALLKDLSAQDDSD